ncbi:MAG: ABC transporter ATP-binding protein [Thermoplasmatota archaeon]
MSVPLLRTRDFTKNFPNNRGVGPIDLELEPGIHGLVGPNGSGKTTFVKTLLGFYEPTAGRAELLGLDTRRDLLNVRRRVGYMAENDVIVPGLNAVQTVRLAGELCGVPSVHAHEAAAEAMHAVGLGDERFHNPARLSTGQRQKVKLAAALVHAPEVLFLDEPTNGLDPRARVEFMELVRELADEKHMSILLSTHILPDMERLCEQAIVLRQGRLVAVEHVKHRSVLEAGKNTWYTVQVIQNEDAFLAACRKKWEVDIGSEVRIAAPTPLAVMQTAQKVGAVMAGIRPATIGVEDAVLAHMEDA